MTAISFLGTGAIETLVKITGNTATDIIAAIEKAVPVALLQVNENAGSTPNLTVAMTDGTTTYYLGAAGKSWVANAVSAKQSVEFSPFVVPKGFTLKVTSSDAAGKFDVLALSEPLG